VKTLRGFTIFRNELNAGLLVIRITLFLIFIIILLGGCRSGGDPSPVIVKLNGRDIHRSEFEQFLATKMGDVNGPDIQDSIRSQMLDEYIKRQLVLEDAARMGLNVSTAEIEESTQDNPQMKSSVSTANNRDEIMRDLLVEKYYRQVTMRDARVSPEEVQQYIEKNLARLTDRPALLVREIRVQSREEADRLRREVTERRRDFASVARLHSDAPNAERNGLTRYEEGQLPDLLAKAVQQLRPGEVSPVIESNYGFHLFKMEQRIQPHAPDERRSQLDDRRAQLTEELIARRNQQAVDNALERLTSVASIQIWDSALGFPYTGQLRHN
jgi:parvulin-like peptidyl-prolyl isomerase